MKVFVTPEEKAFIMAMRKPPPDKYLEKLRRLPKDSPTWAEIKALLDDTPEPRGYTLPGNDR